MQINLMKLISECAHPLPRTKSEYIGVQLFVRSQSITCVTKMLVSTKILRQYSERTQVV